MSVKEDEKALWALVEAGRVPRLAGLDLGISNRRVCFLCGKWAQQGRYDYGVSVDLGWVK